MIPCSSFRVPGDLRARWDLQANQEEEWVKTTFLFCWKLHFFFVEKKCSFGQECSAENKTWVFGKWDVCDPQIESLLKHIPPLLVSPQGRAGADGARGMPGESGTKVVTSLWGHSSFQHELLASVSLLFGAELVTWLIVLEQIPFTFKCKCIDNNCDSATTLNLYLHCESRNIRPGMVARSRGKIVHISSSGFLWSQTAQSYVHN